MKIGVILPHLFLFGGVRRYIELASAFISRGDEFVIYTPSGEQPSWIALEGACRRLREARAADHDVMITGSPEFFDDLKEIPASIRIFYLQLEGIDREGEIVRDPGVFTMTNSSGVLKRVSRKYGVEALDGRGGINPRLFHPSGRDAGEGSGPFRIMCYGRLSRPRKGARFVVEAARSMYRGGKDVELVLFDSVTPGGEDPRPGFDPGLPFRFYIDLPQERMSAMYGTADVFVSAEHRAGWSNTCAEAAACGRPLVCTSSGTEDFAVDGVNAIVVRRSAGEIRNALERLYGDRRMCAGMGREGAKIILDFTWEKVCDRMSRQFAALTREERTSD